MQTKLSWTKNYSICIYSNVEPFQNSETQEGALQKLRHTQPQTPSTPNYKVVAVPYSELQSDALPQFRVGEFLSSGPPNMQLYHASKWAGVFSATPQKNCPKEARVPRLIHTE